MRSFAILLVLFSLCVYISAQTLADDFTLGGCTQEGVNVFLGMNSTVDITNGATDGFGDGWRALSFYDQTNTSVYVADGDSFVYRQRLSDGRRLDMYTSYNGSSAFNIMMSAVNGIDTDFAGHVYVAEGDTTLGATIFKSTPGFASLVGMFVVPNGAGQGAYSVHVDKSAGIVYAGTMAGPVVAWDLNGNYLFNFTAASGQQIYGIATDLSHNIYTVDNAHSTVQKFSRATLSLAQAYTPSTGSFGTLYGIYVDNAGYVYVMDDTSSTSWVFTNSGATTFIYTYYFSSTTLSFSGGNDRSSMIGDGSTFTVQMSDLMIITTCGLLPGSPAPTPTSSSSTGPSSPTPTPTPTHTSSSSGSGSPTPTPTPTHTSSSSGSGSPTPTPTPGSSTTSTGSGNNSGFSTASSSLLTLAAAMLLAIAVLLL